MKRPMTLVGGILAVVVDSIYAIFSLIGIAAIIELIGAGSIMSVVMYFVPLIIIIDGIIMNAIAISAFACDNDKYEKRKRLLIETIVGNIVIVAFMIYSMVIVFSILNLFVLLGSLAASVLYIVDLCLEKDRVAKQTALETPKTEAPKDAKVEVETAKVEPQKVETKQDKPKVAKAQTNKPKEAKATTEKPKATTTKTARPKTETTKSKTVKPKAEAAKAKTTKPKATTTKAKTTKPKAQTSKTTTTKTKKTN